VIAFLYFVRIDLKEKLVRYLDKWANEGVYGHHIEPNWVDVANPLKEPMSRLIGASPSEVVFMNTLTVNVHMMMASFYRPTPTRHKILMEKKAFPSDQYATYSQIELHGFSVEQSLIEVEPREGEYNIRLEDIEAILDREGESIALVHIGGVHYYTGQLFDMAAITAKGHSKGCIVGFDLAHGVGNVPMKLHDWGVDFATWCTYKYLNSGPGCMGGAFVHSKHTDPSISGS
jgi:kynureninase